MSEESNLSRNHNTNVPKNDEEENVPCRLYYADGMQVTYVNMVFTKDDLKSGHPQRSFRPDMVHQVFDKDGIIYGYRNLNIDIYYLANSAQAFVDLKYTDATNDKMPNHTKPDDIMSKLTPWLPEDYCATKEMFLNAIENENHHKMYGEPIDTFQLHNAKEGTTYKYTVTSCSVDEPGFVDFHYRFQCMIVWFIDAASQIDADDPNWMFLYVYEHRKQGSSSTTGIYPVGFSTVYKFFHFPDKVRARISQFFIIPSCQGMGLGTYLLKNTYKIITDLPNVVDIAVEDPCPAFTRIRDFLDCQLLMQLDCFKEPNIKNGFVNSMYVEGNKHYKINKKQCRRVYEVLRFSYIKCNRFSADYAMLYKEISQRLKIPYLKEQRCLKKINSEILSEYSNRISLESVEKNIAYYMSDIISAAQQFSNKMDKQVDA
ncbi:hypothetical protein RN001_016019 [Aquatica leii]|uniref:Histone acetyltransferase type B catalytic subunit n=1 Tax=Aquatica leii TaxID=1421715 RepID=A0AAN7PXZ1_9COLE|nr:hypothetical protein RN001_016019 [Aquatica leii]